MLSVRSWRVFLLIPGGFQTPGRKIPAREGQVSSGGALPTGGRGRSSPCPEWGTAPTGWDEEQSRRGRRQTLFLWQGGHQVPVSCLCHAAIAVPPPWGPTAAPPLLNSPEFVPIQQESGSQGELSPPMLLPCLEAAGFTLLGLIHAGCSRLPGLGLLSSPGQGVTLLGVQHFPVQRRVGH